MNNAILKKLHPHIEEEVTLEINGFEFTGFSTICPYVIEEGREYPVFISFTILDQSDLLELDKEIKELARIDDSYRYYIHGILHEDYIDAGIKIYDDNGYFNDYKYLAGKPVELLVDRIAVDFLDNN
ncbi:hypothetical protein OIO07_13070 [Bacillus paralicheniformis]|uniref:hypothetical protein n=1 Tax=Bacillus TaxID=1386 RepID=UPI00034240D7|nr:MULTISPECIES: hypothetical protein [Bacillus]KUL13755.1 hypothetical protein LI7559_05040 [Bacillus licheniformis LMG 7559]AGN37961.1 hypothetical protein BaLi_c36460 [Bacillus paralicheniformis ATCC 9945a]ARA87251.1 hypothetical protein BLMD_18175 [Bacillus paralicheniformis]AYQ18025.1 hypothetical protein D5285_19130 [Bacillus paralicheniformis]KND07618.1 hypothetical protein ACJ43_09590 [Bacillus paralicheniformis]